MRARWRDWNTWIHFALNRSWHAIWVKFERHHKLYFCCKTRADFPPKGWQFGCLKATVRYVYVRGCVVVGACLAGGRGIGETQPDPPEAGSIVWMFWYYSPALDSQLSRTLPVGGFHPHKLFVRPGFGLYLQILSGGTIKYTGIVCQQSMNPFSEQQLFFREGSRHINCVCGKFCNICFSASAWNNRPLQYLIWCYSREVWGTLAVVNYSSVPVQFRVLTGNLVGSSLCFLIGID